MQPLFDLGDGQALAGRPALVQAVIAVGVELAVVAKDADLVIADEYDPAVAILEFRGSCRQISQPCASPPLFDTSCRCRA